MAALAFCCDTARARELKIVATTTDLRSIAKSVAGGRASVKSICVGNEDPHYLQAKPSYIMMARGADLWIRVGMELEIGRESPIIDGSRNKSIRVGMRGHLDASENVLRLQVPSVRVTRAMGDVHLSGNPHYWLDPLNGRIVARAIAERLAQLSPADAKVFRTNLVAFERALDEHMFGKELVQEIGGAKLWGLELRGDLLEFLDQRNLREKLGGWAAKMRPFRGMRIVTYHRSWTYLAHRFKLIIPAELERKPGIPPSGSHLAKVVELVKGQGIKAILMEPFYSRRAADLVASKTGARVVVCASSVGGQAGATDYLALMDLIVNRLSEALRAE